MKSEAYKQDAAGKWQNPDGSPLEVTINAPSNFEVQSGRLAFAVADSWRKFGVRVNVQQLESGPFGPPRPMESSTLGRTGQAAAS